MDQSTIDRIIDAADIVDVVSGYVTLRRAGASYKGLCPFHDDKTPSFYVSPSKGLCKCFSCGKGGNVVHFIMEEEQLSYYEALKFLAKKYGIEVEDRQLTDEERLQQNERESMFAVNEWASNYFHDTMMSTDDGRSIGLAYFRTRGFRDDIIEKFKLGFCLPSYDAMSKAAVKKGFREDFIVKTGLAFRRDDGTLRDRYRDRAIFPWFAVSGKIVAFGGRVLDARTKGVNQKYINSPESDIFHKSRELYGIFQAKKAIAKEDRVFMVEGYTDVISMHQCGIENVVANSGTALNVAQIKLLHRFTSNITLLYDGDSAGIHAALRGTDMLLAEGMHVKILLLPDGDDPDSFARKHTSEDFKAYIDAHQTDFIIFKTNLLMEEAGRDPIKRAQLISDIVKSIAVIPEEITRAVYIRETSQMLNVEERILLNETEKIRKQELERLARERERMKESGDAASRPTSVPSDAASSSAPQQIPENAVPSSVAGDAPAEISPLPTEIPADLYPNVAYPPQNGVPEALPPADSVPLPDAEPKPVYLEAQKTPADSSKYFRNNRFIELEGLIMTLVVRYGECEISGEDAEGNAVSVKVVDYVCQELEGDGLQLQHPLYRQMLDEARNHSSEVDFKPSRMFLSSPSLEVSRTAADMLSERYQLSSLYAKQEVPTEREQLDALIVHLMFDYKLAVVNAELKSTQEALRDPAVLADMDKCAAILKKNMMIKNIQQKLARHVGDRVLLK
ncbi:MAG: DNA primase [Bacteroides sp. 43_108]|nr:MAG: DNA primase [Bacteroides sp. 43_108]